MREVMDSLLVPWVREVTLMKATQVAGTECLLNMLGFAIDQDPGPSLFVVPKDELIGKFNFGRLRPMVRASARLRAHETPGRAGWNEKTVTFDRMPLYFGAATTPADLASHAIRYAFCDELDKWPKFSGREADPLSLVRERTSTYPDCKIVKVSTPTTPQGYINSEYARSDRRHYHVPCPQCGHFQVLLFDRVKFPSEERDPARIAREALAWYECVACAAHIPEIEKPRMLARGVWVPEGAELRADGTIRGDPQSDHRGYHLNALYSPWRTWSQVAAEFIRAKEEVGGLMNFVNSWLGQVWVEKATETKADYVATLVAEYPENHVPKDVMAITCGVDVQAREIYYTVRGWGAGYRSWKIASGILNTWEQLAGLLTKGVWKRGDERLQIQLACVDSGFRTDEVYEFCREHEDVARPIKGEATIKAGGLFRSSRIERTFDGKPFGITLWRLDTSVLKDKLTRLMRASEGEPGRWLIHANPRPDYLRHLVSEHKIVVRNRTTGMVKEEWQKRGEGLHNEFWDCEVYALAAAEMLHVYALAGGEQEETQTQDVENARHSAWIGRTDGWIEPRREGWINAG